MAKQAPDADKRRDTVRDQTPFQHVSKQDVTLTKVVLNRKRTSANIALGATYFLKIYSKHSKLSEKALFMTIFYTRNSNTHEMNKDVRSFIHEHEVAVSMLTPVTALLSSRSNRWSSSILNNTRAPAFDRLDHTASYQGYSLWGESRWTTALWRWWAPGSSCPSGCPDRSPPDCWCCSGRSSCETSPDAPEQSKIR